MDELALPRGLSARLRMLGVCYGPYGGIAVLGLLLYWLSANHPSAMPAWAPWDFSAPEYLATALTLFWFWRGLAASAAADRPRAWRSTSFLIGLGLIYAVLQTHFEYWSQHMFFLNRIQHVAMHHFGPFLMALGGAGATLRRGMPTWLGRILETPAVGMAIRVLQQPVIAAVLFVGLFALWLIPPLHFRAMLDGRLYALMNWSMVLDGLLFWSLVLDRRPKPPARTSYGIRAALALGVMFPQIVLGAIIGFSNRDLYPYYDLCGRIIPSIGAINDQHIGGIIIWIPPAMMSVIGMLLVINALRIHEDSTREADPNAASLAALSSRWTGR
jgi:putative membrane protein